LFDIKIFSFFAGSGFLDLGFEKSGFRIELVNEFHKPFLDAYIHSRDRIGLRKPEYGYFNCDITEFLKDKNSLLKEHFNEAKKGESIVGFIGGPPCPDFSIGGKNRGRHGDNGKLSKSFVDVISDVGPDFFFFENVKGLWKTAKHRAFYEELKNQLRDSGYWMTERLTNALEYGSPQDRERIILFGIKRNTINAGGGGNLLSRLPLGSLS
jgi:DNA (cytosine-5)-methyltransferase 1